MDFPLGLKHRPKQMTLGSSMTTLSTIEDFLVAHCLNMLQFYYLITFPRSSQSCQLHIILVWTTPVHVWSYTKFNCPTNDILLFLIVHKQQNAIAHLPNLTQNTNINRMSLQKSRFEDYMQCGPLDSDMKRSNSSGLGSQHSDGITVTFRVSCCYVVPRMCWLSISLEKSIGPQAVSHCMLYMAFQKSHHRMISHLPIL